MGILSRILNPNGRKARMNRMSFKTFIRAKAKGMVTDGTLELYDKDRQQLQGWLGARALTVETAQELEAWLKKEYPKANTQQRKVTSLNWLLRWKGVDYQARRPPKEPNLNPKQVPDERYRAVLGRAENPEERLAVRLVHDCLGNPGMVVKIRVSQIVTGPDGRTRIIFGVRDKSRAPYAPVLDKETAAELRAFVESSGVTDYLFVGDRRKGRPHKNRTWINEVHKRHGADFTPRDFRSTGASAWPDGAWKELMLQGGWASLDTIMRHYRAGDLEKQARSFEAAMRSRTKDPESDDELPGYG